MLLLPLLLCVGLPVLLAPGGCGATRTCCSATGVPGEQLCCPAGHRCSADGRSCVREAVVWCDSTGYCPDGSTCCQTTAGTWNCCPLAQGVCCQDHVHCCPHGTTCNLAVSSCDNSSAASVPLFRKVPTFSATPLLPAPGAGHVKCDASRSCPDTKTCCKNRQGGWSCCPLPQAVCCADHEHCCPTGTTCDLTTLTCNRGSESTPMWRKEPAVMVMAMRSREPMEEAEEAEAELVNPCDDHTSCKDSETCCLNKRSEKWGCCPLPKAVCCEGGHHCCPSGFQCSGRHSCTAGGFTFPWYATVAASSNQKKLRSALLAPPTPPTPPAPLSDVPCDETTSCEDGQTCCRMSATQWGCCPLPHAVCCSDRLHCCPTGSTCTAAGECVPKPRPYWSD
ncbi:granulin a [Nelusetta ayraudi]|uniref:granulin a n=1 Tax=Nelusetta ayraudi TaxID=303726 RepID=UPI003F6EA8F3